jgi:hypothetical protein
MLIPRDFFRGFFVWRDGDEVQKFRSSEVQKFRSSDKRRKEITQRTLRAQSAQRKREKDESSSTWGTGWGNWEAKTRGPVELVRTE